jgi:hypothetical protein
MCCSGEMYQDTSSPVRQLGVSVTFGNVERSSDAPAASRSPIQSNELSQIYGWVRAHVTHVTRDPVCDGTLSDNRL